MYIYICTVIIVHMQSSLESKTEVNVNDVYTVVINVLTLHYFSENFNPRK